MASERLDVSVVQSARANVPDFYLAGLLANREHQSDLVVWAALVGDLASVPARVSEPMIGHIRLQWWGDWLENLEPSGNAIADASAPLLKKHPSLKGKLQTILEAQHSAIDALAPGAGHEHQRMTGTFYSAAFAAVRSILQRSREGKTHEEDVSALLRSAGVAYGTARTLLLLRTYAKHGLWPLPESASDESDTGAPSITDREQGIAASPDADFPSQLVTDESLSIERQKSVKAAISIARTNLETVSSQYYAQSRATAHALLPIALVEPYFQSFENTTEDPLMCEPGVSAFARHWKLLRAWWKLPVQS